MVGSLNVADDGEIIGFGGMIKDGREFYQVGLSLQTSNMHLYRVALEPFGDGKAASLLSPANEVIDHTLKKFNQNPPFQRNSLQN
jgi:hypothetical protein